uniref:Uncharacterized protein n=1 Tax=Acrobeloides nanus TaxID=290746 RepID=A0A914DS07_9BILA
MANEDLPRVWEQFLDAAKNGTKKGGIRIYKVAMCKAAVKLSDKLIEHGYCGGDRYDLWKEYIGKICATLEGDDEVIQRIVREYFLGLHSGDVSEFSIKFTDKDEGTSIGRICDVKLSGKDRRFYIKCHQRGSRSSSISMANRYNNVNPPFIQEIFVYKLFDKIKVGGEVYFPLPISSDTKKALYIATEEIKFILAKNLTPETANADAMILVNFLQYVLCLEDIGTNGGNYGQSDEGKPVIVDFWVVPKYDYVLSDVQIRDFWEGPHNCNSRLISDILRNVAKEKREEVIRGAIEEWKLASRIDEAKSFVEEFVTKNGEKLEISGDLNRYVRDIKSSLDKMFLI